MPLSVEPASPDQAPDIYRVLASAFAPAYLKFTIYQSPLAEGFVRQQIETSAKVGAPTFFVLREGGSLLGFYSAIRRRCQSFLSYIATADSARGRGAGSVLLHHFESAAAEAGCLAVGLDVFRSNAAAWAWYTRRGYVETTTRHHYRFAVEGLTSDRPGALSLDGVALAGARREEAQRGFSRISGALGASPVQLGLINGSVCNVLDPQGGAALLVAEAAARTFRASRKWVLVTSPEPLPEALSADSHEEAVRMERPVFPGPTAIQRENG